MSYATYQVIIAGILFANFLLISAYALWRKDARPEILRAGALLNLLGAACWGFAAYFSSEDASNALQSVVYNVRAIPFDAAIAYIAWLLARSIANNQPRAADLLRNAWLLIGACWLFGFVVGLFLPVPALEEFGPTPPEFLLLKVRNGAEWVVLLLVLVVFAGELLKRETPSRTVRLQNGAMTFAAVCFLALASNFIYGSVLRVLSLSPAEKSSMIDLHLYAETLLLGVGGVAYMAGLFLYHSHEERERLLDLFREWIKLRHDIETRFDLAYSNGLECGDATGYFYRACTYLELTSEQRQKALDLVKLLSILRTEPDDTLLGRLSDVHERLRRNSGLASRVFVQIDGRVLYDIRHDPLFSAAAPAISLFRLRTTLFLRRSEDWTQLAALLAADAGFLPAPVAHRLLREHPPPIKRNVLSAYECAKTAEKLTR